LTKITGNEVVNRHSAEEEDSAWSAKKKRDEDYITESVSTTESVTGTLLLGIKAVFHELPTLSD
jgi:hypothetical protein